MAHHVVELNIGGRTLKIETGKIAKQAAGATVVTMGDTMVFAGVTDDPARPWWFEPASADGVYGVAWQWTRSPATPYPGARDDGMAVARPFAARYDATRFVARGGSCITPSGHVRPSLRLFLDPDARWQFTGIRLAKDTQEWETPSMSRARRALRRPAPPGP